MIDIEIFTVEECDRFEYSCENDSCKHNVLYHETPNNKQCKQYGIFNQEPFIKVGSTAIMFYSSYYCRECIDELYKFIKSKIDTKLWAFQ